MVSVEEFTQGIEHIYNPAEQDAITVIAKSIIDQVDERTSDLDISDMVDELIVRTVLHYEALPGHPYSPIKADKEKKAKEKIIAKIKRSISSSKERKPISSENIKELTLNDLPTVRRAEAVALVEAIMEFYSEERNVDRPISEAIEISMKRNELVASDLVQEIVAREYSQISANLKKDTVEKSTQTKGGVYGMVKSALSGFFKRS